MSNSKLDSFKGRWEEATVLAIQEMLDFAETVIPAQKPDEDDNAYIARLNRLSSAKTKKLKETKELMDAMQDRLSKDKDEQGSVNKNETSEISEQRADDFPRPEDRAS